MSSLEPPIFEKYWFSSSVSSLVDNHSSFNRWKFGTASEHFPSIRSISFHHVREATALFSFSETDLRLAFLTSCFMSLLKKSHTGDFLWFLCARSLAFLIFSISGDIKKELSTLTFLRFFGQCSSRILFMVVWYCSTMSSKSLISITCAQSCLAMSSRTSVFRCMFHCLQNTSLYFCFIMF